MEEFERRDLVNYGLGLATALTVFTALQFVIHWSLNGFLGFISSVIILYLMYVIRSLIIRLETIEPYSTKEESEDNVDVV